MQHLTTPGPTVGVVGGGQLGRMLAEAASPLGVELIVLDPTPNCPASSVAENQIVADFDDPDAIMELGKKVDVLTFEIELASPDLLEKVHNEIGVPVHPDPDTLRMIQDKYVQKQRLADADIPVPTFTEVTSQGDLETALDELGSVMVKAKEGGYDGRGNVPVESLEEIESALSVVDQGAMAEEFLDFKRELSVIGIKGADDSRAFPVGENIHRDEILRETVVPARAPENVLEEARSVALDVLELMDGRGVFGIELFQTTDDAILVNEIAPRPHNSGHWTIEGAVSSQFEQHIRAVLGWPLASTAQRCPTAMLNLLGDVDKNVPAKLAGVETLLDSPGVSLHWYGKREARPLRKLGHITLTADGSDLDEVNQLLSRGKELRDKTTFIE
ncbi:5-(carboxyamino)imidazole ribonucleotide synthase [Salinarchaeum sp. IM2453]|uniref:5-(carboxyamino)imidazole ribonucleotide synthase n=1 Tax=Salinarchaeum sp. IM2453 TaxID=2862870 RepID=UPI001C831008|nr:5-(carboxyamino)imidazole ribonucleotide synthase [Salinarchaeum sp. IM2453]QZA87721.1 5-(carboxyamino)imidazole ribonucleotide synthase [Salinarchaeum sp. IM2453]